MSFSDSDPPDEARLAFRFQLLGAIEASLPLQLEFAGAIEKFGEGMNAFEILTALATVVGSFCSRAGAQIEDFYAILKEIRDTHDAGVARRKDEGA